MKKMNKSIFLYFLDSELQHTLPQPMTEAEIREGILLSVLAAKDVYVSASHVFTLPYMKVAALLNELQKQEIVKFLLAGKDGRTFLQQHYHKYKYYDDEEKYPYESKRYGCFIDGDMYPEIPANCISKKGSASEFIRHQLKDMVAGKCIYKELRAVHNEQIVEIVREHLPNTEQALTIAAFRPYFYQKYSHKEASEYILELQQALAFFHNKSLMMEMDSSILFNVSKCKSYNLLDINSIYDAGILRIIFEPYLDYLDKSNIIDKILELKDERQGDTYYKTLDIILLNYQMNSLEIKKIIEKFMESIRNYKCLPSLLEYVSVLADVVMK